MAKKERHGAAHKITAKNTQDQSAHHQVTQASAKTQQTGTSVGKRSSTK